MLEFAPRPEGARKRDHATSPSPFSRFLYSNKEQPSEIYYTEKCRFTGKEVREISRYFVAPPREFPAHAPPHYPKISTPEYNNSPNLRFSFRGVTERFFLSSSPLFRRPRITEREAAPFPSTLRKISAVSDAFARRVAIADR